MFGFFKSSEKKDYEAACIVDSLLGTSNKFLYYYLEEGGWPFLEEGMKDSPKGTSETLRGMAEGNYKFIKMVIDYHVASDGEFFLRQENSANLRRVGTIYDICEKLYMDFDFGYQLDSKPFEIKWKPYRPLVERLSYEIRAHGVVSPNYPK